MIIVFYSLGHFNSQPQTTIVFNSQPQHFNSQTQPTTPPTIRVERAKRIAWE